MKKMLMSLGLAAMLAQGAGAMRPWGWIYVDYPWAYQAVTTDWHWLNTADTQWVHEFSPAPGWKKLPQSALASGWVYFQWPYAYAQANQAWHYVSEADTQWIVNMRSQLWSRFGQIAPGSGQTAIPGGTYAGVDPDFGAYSYAVNSFYMDVRPVIGLSWEIVNTAKAVLGYEFDNAGSHKSVTHPVHTVNWYDCVKWCNLRSEVSGREPVYYTDAALTQAYRTGRVDNVHVKTGTGGYALPTVAEWRAAARGGVAGRRFPWGTDTISHDEANYYSTVADAYDVSLTRGYHSLFNMDFTEPFTSEAGSFPANGYGLFDMAGNVRQWCWDWGPGLEGQKRSVQGSSYSNTASESRIGYSFSVLPEDAAMGTGFRSVIRR
jgi:formylglycine-generating enzyme